jgi:hypothetical protein
MCRAVNHAAGIRNPSHKLTKLIRSIAFARVKEAQGA